MPRSVAHPAYRIVDSRTTDEHRLNDISGTIQIRLTYDLAIRCGILRLHHYCCYVLEHISSQHSLDDKHMVVTANHLHHPQIINITVAVEVEVRDHITRRVEYHLKLLHRLRLSESSTYSLKVEIQAQVLRHRVHLYHRRGGLTMRGADSGGGLCRSINGRYRSSNHRGLHRSSNRRRSRGYSHQCGQATRASQTDKSQCKKHSRFHIYLVLFIFVIHAFNQDCCRSSCQAVVKRLSDSLFVEVLTDKH